MDWRWYGIENQVHFATIPVGVVKHGEAVNREFFDGGECWRVNILKSEFFKLQGFSLNWVLVSPDGCHYLVSVGLDVLKSGFMFTKSFKRSGE